MQMKSCH